MVGRPTTASRLSSPLNGSHWLEMALQLGDLLGGEPLGAIRAERRVQLGGLLSGETLGGCPPRR